MAIPEEDLGPAWLRDWTHIEADIKAMEDFAKKLKDEVTVNYAPHASKVHDDMMAALPPPPSEFGELVALLDTHHVSQQATSDLVHFYSNATGGMADAASKIGQQYGQADAFSSARVSDVNKALDQSGVTAPTPPGSLPPGSLPPGSLPPGSASPESVPGRDVPGPGTVPVVDNTPNGGR
jgi:hypothetical protein